MAWRRASRAFFGLISEAVWWVTIRGSTLVRYHLEAYDGGPGNRPSEERQRVGKPWRGLRYAISPLRTDC